MSIVKSVDFNQLNNHDLRKMAESTFEVLKLSMTQGLNAKIAPKIYRYVPETLAVKGINYQSVASAVLNRIKSYDEKRMRMLRVALGNDTSITKSIRARRVNMRSKTPVREQLIQEFSFINEKTFNEKSVNKMIEEVFGNATETGPISPLNKAVKFSVSNLLCYEETKPEWGRDEIRWGGVMVDDKGVSSIIPECEEIEGIKTGDTRPYQPPKCVANFPLDNNYPKTFMITMGLAEKDEGGFADFLNDLWEAIKTEIYLILSALGTAAGAWVGAQLGVAIGTTIAGPLGTVIGLVAGAVLGSIVGWFISTFRDEIFTPQATALYLGTGCDTLDNGSLLSTVALDYQDHGGHYQLYCDWEIVR